MSEQPRRPDAEDPGPRAGVLRPIQAQPGLAALDDVDAEVYTIGQAAELLGVPVAALRRLDDAGALRPGRSTGRQRRYSRRQLLLAQRVLALVADGTAITAARRIADLEGEIRDLREQLDRSEPGLAGPVDDSAPPARRESPPGMA
ncbi:MAG: MerR family transcriptional regulator [Mycobacteriales bacterium]